MKSGKITKLATVSIACLGLCACNNGTNEDTRDAFIDSIFDAVARAEIVGDVVIDGRQVTTIGFEGDVSVDINNLDDISLDLDCFVSTTNGSYLPFGIQYVDNALYAEYNRGKSNEIDMYVSLASLDTIGDILELFGIDFSLDFDMSSLTGWLEALEFVKKDGDVDEHWELDINGTALCFSGTKKGAFTGDIWCVIDGGNTTTITATVTSKEVVSFWTPGTSELSSWVPLDYLCDVAANTLQYNYYTLTGEFDMGMSMDYSGLSVDINLGFDNLVAKLLIDEKGKLQLGMDFDVRLDTIMSLIAVNGNEETHYFTDGTTTSEMNSTTTNNIHCTIYYDGNYVYMYRADYLTLATHSRLSGSRETVTATDEFYVKETLSGFGANFMDDFTTKILALTSFALSQVSLGGGMATDGTQIKYEDLVTELAYETATVDEEGEEIPERFMIGADLSSFIFGLEDDGSYSDTCPFVDPLVELDLADYDVDSSSVEGLTETRISDIVVTTGMFGMDAALPLHVDYDHCGAADCADAVAFLEEMGLYANEHADDPVNEWVLNLAYQENDPYVLQKSSDGGDTGDDGDGDDDN